MTPDGDDDILILANVVVQVDLVTTIVSPVLVVDTTAPLLGSVNCPEFVQGMTISHKLLVGRLLMLKGTFQSSLFVNLSCNDHSAVFVLLTQTCQFQVAFKTRVLRQRRYLPTNVRA